jgi:predicted nucleic acid-binding protein
MIVVDANIAVSQMIALPFSDHAARRLSEWHQGNTPLIAPALWWYEVVSAMRRAIYLGVIPAMDAWERLQVLTSLGIEVVQPSMDLSWRALEWAQRLGQSRAYDAQYVALAEQVHASFWSADRKLVHGLKAQGVTWAHWIGEG